MKKKTDLGTSGKTAEDKPDPAWRNFKFGWWALLVYLLLGIVLEGMHAFKASGYLSVSHGTRRLMWTLAHAHGTLLALLNIIFALAASKLESLTPRAKAIIGGNLMAATALMPAGFFLGGFYLHGGDPGLGILLLPVGAVFLALAVFMMARASRGPSRP